MFGEDIIPIGNNTRWWFKQIRMISRSPVEDDAIAPAALWHNNITLWCMWLFYCHMLRCIWTNVENNVIKLIVWAYGTGRWDITLSCRLFLCNVTYRRPAQRIRLFEKPSKHYSSVVIHTYYGLSLENILIGVVVMPRRPSCCNGCVRNIVLCDGFALLFEFKIEYVVLFFIKTTASIVIFYIVTRGRILLLTFF